MMTMNKKIRFYFWMFQGYLRKHIVSILIGTLVLFLVIIGLSIWIPTLAKTNDTLFIEGMVGKYTRKQLPPQVLEYISYGLVTTDEAGNPIPRAAESVDNSQDGKTFTVHLKHNITWHNGTPLTTRDLAYSLTDVAIEKPDDYTLIFKLKDSFAPFPTLLTGPLLKITQDDQVLGIGDYFIKTAEYSQSQHLTSLELESETKKPKIIKIKFFATEEDAVTALKLGQIHGLQLSTPHSLANWNNVVMFKKPLARRFVGVYFKYDDPVVGGKDATLRQALSLAVTDTEGELPFPGPFPSSSWATTPTDNKNRNNKDKAGELLKNFKAPQKNQNGKIELTLTTLSPYRATADHIAQDWQNLGIDVKIEEVDKIPEKYQAIVLAQELPTDPDQYSLWHSTQKRSNITGYTNARVDKDLEDARKTMDRTVRKEKYADFQKQLFTDIPVIYLYQPSINYALLKKYNSDTVLRLKEFKI
jgi:peptide/nickel transport system substrate-binding protein